MDVYLGKSMVILTAGMEKDISKNMNKFSTSGKEKYNTTTLSTSSNGTSTGIWMKKKQDKWKLDSFPHSGREMGKNYIGNKFPTSSQDKEYAKK